jgi:adenosylcobinamide-phosphate synthase
MTLLLAVALDLLLGDPPNRWHPVAWIGSGLASARRRTPGRGAAALLSFGALWVVGSSILVFALVAALVTGVRGFGWFGVVIEAWLLKCAFAVRRLIQAAREVKTSLALGNLTEARRVVGWHLVSRPTDTLGPSEVASAAIESVAENLGDSVVAPLFFFLLLGVPGAWAYRVVNTADAMWGYRRGELEHFGKFAARLDDLLNWIPARLAGLAIVLGAFLVGEAGTNGWRTMWRQRRRTASPNAGWLMAAMAGALRVTLRKPDTYELGAGALPAPTDIDRAVRVTIAAAGLVIAACLLVAGTAR